MKFIARDGSLIVEDYSYTKSDEIYLGVIKRNTGDGGYFHFHPSISAIRLGITCRQLRDIAAKLSELNRG